ncbi:hypothetical protein CQW23_03368 [Capsicum baccatum]|uniref:Uncharacterized protein n=1 Tax=Capsicum baccatum TaxID=33114 RepID=A0A2G2XBK0_CAPBA|nr:hypothetical protein CQW23_03368 [Capsicum baccatum]
MPENVNPRLSTSYYPRCKEKYDLELAKLVSKFENSSSKAKLESPRPQLPQWLQNDMLKNDSNVTSLSQVWFYLINGTENDLYCVQAEESYYFLMSLQIKDQGKFELENLQRDSNEIANELYRLKEEMSIDLSLEDVKRVPLHYGFVFEKESTIETTYTTNSRSMLQFKSPPKETLVALISIQGNDLLVTNYCSWGYEFETLDLASTSFASEHHDMKEKSKVDADSTSTLNKKELVVKADLHSLESEMKAYMETYIDQKFKDLECLMNARFTEVLNSLEQKNETVKSPPESIIPSREHDLALTIYKPPPTTPAEYEISDTAIFSAFFMPQKNMSANKNAPAPCSRKPSKIYRSPFLIHFGSSSKEKKKLASNERKKFPFEGYHITGDSPTVEMETFEEWIHDGLYKQHTKKKDDDDHYRFNCSKLEFRQLDFIVAFPKFKNWFYLMYQQNKCWNDEHLDVIMYYLRKKYKNMNFPISRYTTTDYFFKVYLNKAYVNYYNSDVAKDLATQDTSARTDEVADMEKSLINTIKRLSTCAVIALKDRCIRVYDSMASSQKRKQTSESEKDCGVFVAVYVEYLSEGLGIPCSGIDAPYYRLRYSSLLCKYGSEKAENGYFSENDDPPRPRSKFAQKKNRQCFTY